MSKIMYTADWHLGKELYGLDYTKQHFYNAAFSVLELAKELGVSEIYNAGDILDVVKPSEETMFVLKKIHYFLKQHNIAMYVISGNHDYVGKRQWCEIVRDDTDLNSKSGIIPVTYASHPNGLNYAFIKPNVLEELSCVIEPQSEHQPLLLHTPIKEFAGGYGSKNDKYLSVKDLSNTIGVKKFKHIVIGDTHKTMIVEDSGYTYISPGSIENVYANEDIKKYVFIYDTELDILNKVELPCSYVKIKTETPILSEKDLNAFVESIVNASNFKDLVKTKTVLYVWCSSHMEGLCLSTLNKILYGNKDQVVRDLETNPLLIHTIVVPTKKGLKLDNDGNEKLEIINKDELMEIDSFEEFKQRRINERQDLSSEGKALLNAFLNKDYTTINLEQSWSDYNAKKNICSNAISN